MTLPIPDPIRFVYPATIMTDGRPQVNLIA